jgi:hypothetical protein
MARIVSFKTLRRSRKLTERHSLKDPLARLPIYDVISCNSPQYQLATSPKQQTIIGSPICSYANSYASSAVVKDASNQQTYFVDKLFRRPELCDPAAGFVVSRSMDGIRVRDIGCERYQLEYQGQTYGARILTSILVWVTAWTLGSIDQAHEGRLEGLSGFRREVFDDAGVV